MQRWNSAVNKTTPAYSLDQLRRWRLYVNATVVSLYNTFGALAVNIQYDVSEDVAQLGYFNVYMCVCSSIFWCSNFYPKIKNKFFLGGGVLHYVGVEWTKSKFRALVSLSCWTFFAICRKIATCYLPPFLTRRGLLSSWYAACFDWNCCMKLFLIHGAHGHSQTVFCSTFLFPM